MFRDLILQKLYNTQQYNNIWKQKTTVKALDKHILLHCWVNEKRFMFLKECVGLQMEKQNEEIQAVNFHSALWD